MSIKHMLLAVVGGTALVTAASAQAHTVCDEYGRCWEQTDPGEYDDWDHHHHYWGHHHDDWDHHHHHHHDDYDDED